MFKKLLSVLVICSFMFSSVCFAMPSASTAVIANVDNMALQKFLQEPTPDNFIAFQKQRENFAQYMNLLVEANYSGEEVDRMREMWEQVYPGTADLKTILRVLETADKFQKISDGEVVITNAAGEKETFAVVGDQVTFAQGITQLVEAMLQRTPKGSRVAQAKGINPRTEQQFANDQEKEELLKDLSALQAATAAEKASPEEQAIFTQALKDWEDQNEAAYNKGNITKAQHDDVKDVRIPQMRAKNERGNLRFADAQVLSSTVFVLHQNPDAANPDEPAYFAREMQDSTNEVSKHLAQIMDHESVVEGDLAGHDAQLAEGAEQRGRWGNEAVDVAGPAMRNDIINTKLAEKPKGPTIEVSNITGDETLEKEELESIADALGLEDALKNNKDKFTEIATNYVKTARTTSIIQPMVAAQAAYHAKRAMRSPFSELTKEERAKAIADYVNQGGTISVNYDSGVVTKDGEDVPNTILAEILEISKFIPTPTTGPKRFNITATGENATKAEAMLGKHGVDMANKWSVITSEESLLEEEGIAPENIAVIHTDDDLKDEDFKSRRDKLAKAGVFYLQLAKEVLEANAKGDVSKGVYDGLTIALAAIRHDIKNVLTDEEKAKYDEIMAKGGKFELSAIKVANEADYKVVHQEYEKFVSLLIQA